MKTLRLPDGTLKPNYTISQDGQILYKGKPKSMKVGKGGRIYTMMSRISYRVADLVYSSYIIPTGNDHVKHCDKDYTNLNLTNLYVVRELF